MPAPTVNVTVKLSSQSGVPYEGVTVRAKLDVNEVYLGQVISDQAEGVTNASGIAVLACFPNAPDPTGLGTQGSTYTFRAIIPGGRGLNVQARVPNADCNLEDILVNNTVVALDAAQLAVLQAQANAAAAGTSATNAANSATAAATSATNAANSATAASTSATNASNSATAAATSATNAANSATAAASSATNAANSAAAAEAAAMQLADYTALRAYNGGLKSVYITGYLASASPSGIAGEFTRDDSDTTSADNGGTIIVDAQGRRWKRRYDGPVNLVWFGTDTAAVDSWLTLLCASGGAGFAPEGTYSITTGVTAALSASTSIEVAGGARFVAAAGFPSGQRMFLISTGSGSGHTFEWNGGEFDATNQPNSGAGESNDIFSFNATNCSTCVIKLGKTTAGADWLNSGSDSHLFIGGASNITARIENCIGAVDAGIYVSRNIAGDAGEHLDASGNFSKCNTSIIVKRLFKTANIHGNVTDCLNGLGTGTADITGTALVGGGTGYTVRVNAKRTERPAFFQATDRAQVFVQAEDMGVSIAGYSSAVCMALYLSGSTNVQGFVNAHGVNPALVVSGNFRAVYCDERTVTAGTLQSTDNVVHINCSDLGRAFAEANSSDRNTFVVRSRNMTSTPTIVGTFTFHQNLNPTASGWEYNVSQMSFCGLAGGEAVRVTKTANQVNWLQMTGSAASGASGPTMTATGSDTNVPMTLSTKGTGTIFIGGGAGAEGLRISKVASQVNAIEVTGAATGNNPSVAARGADANLDLPLNPKGTGRVRFGAHTANADAPVSGYVEIKDSGGTIRKLAVIS